MNVITGDGSHTLYNEEIGEHYHSRHGAYTESKHVFIKMGLEYFLKAQEVDQVRILEVGFGTGLNFLTTLDYMADKSEKIEYVSIEAYPFSLEKMMKIGHDQYVNQASWQILITHYNEALKQSIEIGKNRWRIFPVLLSDFTIDQQFDIIYFDAFSEIHQPEMWSKDALSRVTRHLKTGGVFVTYAITGNLKRRLKSLGFEIQKVQGAPGKREMLRAIKL